MTDTTSTGKPVWTRCPSCKASVRNDPIDVDNHRRNCPADIIRQLVNMRRDVEKLTGRVDKLEEIEPASTADLDDEAEWPDSDDEPAQQSQYADDINPTSTLGRFGTYVDEADT